MTLKILPNNVRSMLCASAQINNYKEAVEELVYNSLDAEATSIAIRINIIENKILVIDNGCGITKNDFDAIGKRYMTSKLSDISSLKSMPKYHGYRGEFLANIIVISQYVRITSRHKDSEDTWAKTFHGTKTVNVIKMTTRPSKGTTVDINGFLYNLNIKKQEIDAVNDLQNIKSFLEQLSIIHNNISLSLRDDSKNKIAFKIHKKRDVFQTLSVLFNIEKKNVQELQVEKNQYKVKGLIGDIERENGKTWIYLNGKFIKNNSKLHKIINEYINKYIDKQDNNKSKSKKIDNEHHIFMKNNLFYFIFITCPYIDYDINFTVRELLIEFKNWDHIKKMLEKLVKFYVRDTVIKENNKPQTSIIMNNGNKHNTSKRIKKIIDNILGTNLKTLRTLQVQNGVKGKMIKRNNKNKATRKKYIRIQNKNNSDDNHLQPYHLDPKNNTNFQNKSLNDDKVQNNIIKKHEQPSTNLFNVKKLVTLKTDSKTIKMKKKNRKLMCNNHRASKSRNNHMSPTKITSHNLKSNKCKMISNKEKKSKIKKTKETLTNIQSKRSNKMKANDIQNNAQTFMKQQNTFNKIAKYNANNFVDNINTFCSKKQYHDTDLKYNVDYGGSKIKPFKTTYDLVQTILATQKERDNHNYEYIDYPFNNSQKLHSCNVVRTKLKQKPALNSSFLKYTKVDSSNGENMNNIFSSDVIFCGLRCDNSYCASKFTNFDTTLKDSLNKPTAEQYSLELTDIFKEVSYKNDKNDSLKSDSPYYFSANQTLSSLTYKSHHYNSMIKNYIQGLHTNKTQTIRFITKHSIDNFTRTKMEYKDIYKNNFNNRRNIKLLSLYDTHSKQIIDESYTIECTTNNEYHSSHHPNTSMYTPSKKTQNTQESNVYNYNLTSDYGKTYTISSHRSSCGFNINKNCSCESNTLFASNPTIKRKHNDLLNISSEIKIQNKRNINFTAVANSSCILTQDYQKQVVSEESIEPLNVCETIYLENETTEKDYANTFIKNNGFGDSPCSDKNYDNNCGDKNNRAQIIEHQNKDSDNISYHFSNILTNKISKAVNNVETNSNESVLPINMDQRSNCEQGSPSCPTFQNHDTECNDIIDEESANISKNNFDFKTRLRFLPKGMSQMFNKCALKSTCNYNLNEDYYENIIYYDFANDVQVQTEIYEPVVQNAQDFIAKDINKFQNKVHNENRSLVFDEFSLGEAQVLNQVDEKFIASIVKPKYKTSPLTPKYLALFDQHAVHERITLENNLEGYFNEDKWKSIPLDNFVIKLSQDNILYLHNFKDKFKLLGLEWCILNKDEVIINSIPEAILGRNPREAEKVVKAVKNLILEEIKIIQLQKGCISLYPRSIMDLVFSEACRHAIKFGDKLSKKDCNQLLRDLSSCKTPFQCAHGRPVMAVILEIKNDKNDYKINPDSLKRFKLKILKSH